MAARLCPACVLGNLREHCKDSATCSWHRCPSCQVTFDLAAKRGYWNDGRPFVWPKAA